MTATPSSIGPFPTDDQALAALEVALTPGDDKEFTLSQLLEVYSGYDPARSVQVEPDVFVHPDPIYSRDDVIRSLLAEVRRLRGEGG